MKICLWSLGDDGMWIPLSIAAPGSEKEEIKKYKEIFPEKKNFWSTIAKAWVKSNRKDKCDKA